MDMDWTIILTGIGSIVTIIGANTALMAWLKVDVKQMKIEAAADRRAILQIGREIKEEVKNFHWRIYSLEERYRGGK